MVDDQQVAHLRIAQAAWQHHAAVALREYVARLAQRACNHAVLGRRQHAHAAALDVHAVVAAVHAGTHQLVEAGVHQNEMVAARVLGGTHGAQQHAGFGHQEAAGFQLQAQFVADDGFRLLARFVPQAEVVFGVDTGVAVLIGNRQTAPCGNRQQIVAMVLGALDQRHHGATDLLQVRVIHARANVHVQAS